MGQLLHCGETLDSLCAVGPALVWSARQRVCPPVASCRGRQVVDVASPRPQERHGEGVCGLVAGAKANPSSSVTSQFGYKKLEPAGGNMPSPSLGCPFSFFVFFCADRRADGPSWPLCVSRDLERRPPPRGPKSGIGFLLKEKKRITTKASSKIFCRNLQKRGGERHIAARRGLGTGGLSRIAYALGGTRAGWAS